MKRSATQLGTLKDGSHISVFVDLIIRPGYGNEGTAHVETIVERPGQQLRSNRNTVTVVREDGLGGQYQPTRWRFGAMGNFTTLEEGLGLIAREAMSGTVMVLAIKEAQDHGHPAWSHKYGHGPCTLPSAF